MHASTQAEPEFSARPQVTDFWISIVSGLCFYVSFKIIPAALYPLVRSVA